jgi:hypothetical protein
VKRLHEQKIDFERISSNFDSVQCAEFAKRFAKIGVLHIQNNLADNGFIKVWCGFAVAIQKRVEHSHSIGIGEIWVVEMTRKREKHHHLQ